MPTKKKPKRRLHVGRLVLLIFLLLFVTIAGTGVGVMASVITKLPDLSNGIGDMSRSSQIFDMDGNLVDQVHAGENRIPVKLEEVPESLKQAFLATEDREFYSHKGFNLKRIAKAVFVDIITMSKKEGASTITQQLARTALLKDNSKSFTRKLKELILAFQIERSYTKDEIFELYLNWVYFGEGAYGVQAAARTFFGKDVQDLELEESAMLAGMVKAPGGRYSPFRNPENAMARRAVVLANMAQVGYITEEEAKKAAAKPFSLVKKANIVAYNFPYFTDYVASEAERLLEANGIDPQELYTGGLNIYTTMDRRIQQKMQEVYSNPEYFPKGPAGSTRMLESAMVIIDHRTGEIRGMVGGREYTTQKGLNRAVQADRQPGSAIKPIAVYAPALEKGFTPATVLDDSPVTYPNPGSTPYSPKNYDGRFRGLITMREAIKWSVNIPAVKMLDTIGVEEGYKFAKKLGLPLTPQDKNLSLALGGLTKGVSPLEMAAAYGAFANQGILVEPHVITKITDSNGKVLVEVKPRRELVMSEQTAYLITDMLQTVVADGTGWRAKLDRPVAGKTGTTQLPPKLAEKGLKGTTNAWFLGYTPELVAAVYLGYDKTDEKHYLPNNVAGGNYPAMIWKAVMSEALKGVPVTSFPQPKGIVYASVDAKSGLLPSELTPPEFIVNEVFTKDTVPKEVSNVWVQTQVCAETGQLPSPYCPDVVTRVLLKRPPWEGNTAPEDAVMAVPTQVCTIHGPGADNSVISQAETTPVYSPTQENGGAAANGQNGIKAPPAPVLRGTLGRIPETVDEMVVNLAWEVPGGGNDLVYSVERWVDGNPTRYNLALTTTRNYADEKVEINKTYHYRVFAIDTKANLSTPSNEITITVKP